MNTDLTPDTATAGSPRRFNGCAIALLVLTVLALLGAVALSEIGKGLDNPGDLDNDGTSGSVAAPLGPGTTARYNDDLEVTVSRPRREAGGTYLLTITYVNDTDEVLHPGGQSAKSSVSTFTGAPVVVRPGKSLDDHASDYTLTWLNEDEAASVLVPPLGKGKKRTVLVQVRPSRQGIPVTVEVKPPSAGYRETAYWQFDLT
ncbi:hypothetical protein AB0I68_33230 [Streptomyces sp. NPDC050448]|uniref:hypothetical protein n=1 Tax=Streptomyces sp. NPDC050448 TaxID=3155404 RepID=UPI0034263625